MNLYERLGHQAFVHLSTEFYNRQVLVCVTLVQCAAAWSGVCCCWGLRLEPLVCVLLKALTALLARRVYEDEDEEFRGKWHACP